MSAESGIESLIIPNKVKTIAPTAFNNCSGLTNVTFGESLETIEDHAFQFTNISYLKKKPFCVDMIFCGTRMVHCIAPIMK